MRTETKVIGIYSFDELPEEAKQKALENLSDINVDYDWWDYNYEDAENIGLILNEFDIGRSQVCTGVFKWGALECAEAILKEHGETCETHKTAIEYMKERGELVTKYSDGVNVEKVAEDNDYDFDQDCDELDKEFLKSLLEDYLSILRKEHEYRTSEGVIIETINANKYEFTEDGKLY